MGHGAGGHFVSLILNEPTRFNALVFECIASAVMDSRSAGEMLPNGQSASVNCSELCALR